MFNKFKEWYRLKVQKINKLDEVFGLQEKPPKNCPTYLERKVHKRFSNIVNSTNIIVIYGESRQGKTWLIEKYCHNQIRVGCTSNMTLNSLKEAMLYNLGLSVLNVEHTITKEHLDKKKRKLKLGFRSKSRLKESAAESGREKTISTEEVIKAVYKTVDITNNTQVINCIKSNVRNNYFVFDNFHYLSPKVEKDFCSLLKDFNYNEIKIIIVGVWKEASRITSLASDLSDRCEHIDIGSWTNEELNRVIDLGEKALNISISKDIRDSFVKCGVNNIGIFKKIVSNFCQFNNVFQTQKTHRILDDKSKAFEALDKCYDEYYHPVSNRIINLARPKKAKKTSKGMRQKIVWAILRIMERKEIQDIMKGIPYDDIQKELDLVCKESRIDKFSSSNVIQELGMIHTREENQKDNYNFIPMFYFDVHNRKLLVLEPLLYMIKVYSVEGFNQLIMQIK